MVSTISSKNKRRKKSKKNESKVQLDEDMVNGDEAASTSSNVSSTINNGEDNDDVASTTIPRMVSELEGYNNEGSYWQTSGNQENDGVINAIVAYHNSGTSIGHYGNCLLMKNNFVEDKSLENSPASPEYVPEASLATPQYGFNKGIRLFGDEGLKATQSELDENLLGMDAIEPMHECDVDNEVIASALNYLMFLKRKITGQCKARGCVDGRPQREYITREESSSPTVSIYALMLSCVMDAIEERHVMVLDIPGAFLQADYPSDKNAI